MGRDPIQVRESDREARRETRQLGKPRNAGAWRLSLSAGRGSSKEGAMVTRIRGESRSLGQRFDREGRGLAGTRTGRETPMERKATTKARFVVDGTRVPTHFAVAEPPGGG